MIFVILSIRMDFSHVIITFITVVIIALSVVLIANRPIGPGSKPKARGGPQPQMKDPPAEDALTDERLKQAILEAIGAASGYDRRSQEAANTISGIFTRELEKKVTLNKEELRKQYSSIIEQKDQSEKTAWEKYSKVSSDKKKAEAVIRSIAEGLVVVDSKGSVVMMNPTAEKLLGVSQHDKIGKSIFEDIKKEHLVSLSTNAPEGEDREIEIVSQENETKKILRSSSAVIENENGQTVGMVAVLSDVTKQRELDQAKSDFVSKVSHEFRTPVITIQNSVVLLLDKKLGPITKDQKEFLNIAKRSLDRLAALIDDLLDVSKMEASKIELKMAACSVEKLIKDSCDALNTWAMTKLLKIKIGIQKDLPEINIDYNRMIQVMNNIVGNAIKFTPPNGTITIEAGLSQDKQSLLISVSDTGAGIPKHELDKIFDKFYQAGEKTLMDISGTGLGLTIAKEIVLMHKGKIWAESEESKGSTLKFTLPITAVK